MISEETAIISLYNINWLVFITETECVYCALRTGYSNVIRVNLGLSRVSAWSAYSGGRRLLDVTPCSLVEDYRRFERTLLHTYFAFYCFHSLKGICMYAAFHGSVYSYCGAVSCNTLPRGTVRQNLLSVWDCMLRWISYINCQYKRCHGWDHFNGKWFWHFRTNGRETDTQVIRHSKLIFIASTIRSIMKEMCVVVGWSALFWKMELCHRCVGPYWTKPLKISANSKQVCKYSDIILFPKYRLSLPACPRSLNRNRWDAHWNGDGKWQTVCVAS